MAFEVGASLRLKLQLSVKHLQGWQGVASDVAQWMDLSKVKDRVLDPFSAELKVSVSLGT